MSKSKETSMTIMTQASEMLAKADTIQKAKELKDLALTAADWAKRKGMGEEAIRHAKSYAIEAERKIGEMLKATERAKAGRPSKNKISTPKEPISAPTLSELGLTKKESSRAQVLAVLPKREFEAVKSGEKTVTQVRRERHAKAVVKKAKCLPKGKYRVLYADPPWKYGDQLTENYGATKYHYPAMSIRDLCDLPVKELAADDAVLFLWVTSPILPEAFDVITAWGFKYKASFVWDKVKHNMGHYNSVRHEFLLICTRGSCLPDSNKLIDSVQSIERSARHSEKPEEFRQIIVDLYPEGKRIELFARKDTKDWEVWGNEIQGTN